VPDPVLTLTDAPDAAARAVIDDGLDAFNRAAAGYVDSRPLAVLISDPATGAVVGGLSGRTSFGVLFIDLVFLPAELRGREIGTRVVGLAEAEALRRGCRAGVLYTISFQAPEFYERHGYRRFGTIDCQPPGTTRVFLSKALGRPTAGD
jgi:GNAT superfamily N-acetyltransferase